MITNDSAFTDTAPRVGSCSENALVASALSSSSGDTQKSENKRELRKRRPCRPIVVEVCGAMDDPCVTELVNVLRKYCVRYSMLLRMVSTLFATPLAEEEIFGVFSGKNDEHRKLPVSTAPLWAVTANFSVPVIERFHSHQGRNVTERREKPAYRESPDSIISVANDLKRCRNQFHDFMSYQFFPLVLQENFKGENDEGLATRLSTFEPTQLIMRHYVHETTRTGSFLVGDLKSKKAVLIDPLQNTDEYEADIQRFSLDLFGILVTHCFVDVLSGVERLKSKYPDAKVWSGFSLEPAGTTHQVNVSEFIFFVTVAVPSFSPENIVVEMYLHNTLVALFTGTVWSTDATPRADLYHDFFSYSCAQVKESEASEEEKRRFSINIAFSSLSQHFRDRYFSATSPLISSMSRDKVLFLPSHGGYNNVTNQLDLYWGCFLGDILRAKHSKKVLDALSSLEAYTEMVLAAQSLPFPLLFRATRWSNLTSLWNAAQEDQKKVILNHLLETSERSTYLAMFSSDMKAVSLPRFIYPQTPLLFLDCREFKEYHQLHIRGSVCVPMTFPATAFDALRAELWLQCLLLPGQSVVALCSSETHKTEIKSRIELLSPDAIIEVVTFGELVGSVNHHESSSFSETSILDKGGDGVSPSYCISGSYDNGGAQFFSAACNAKQTHVILPASLDWVQYNEPLYRLDTHEKLEAAQPRKIALVVDVRTPPEFKNGSHQYCIPYTLSALCELSAQDHMNSQQCPSPTLSSLLMTSLKSKFYYAAQKDPSLAKIMPPATKKDPVGWKEIIFYCAAGYRSLIAISLFRRAFEASYKHDESSAKGSVLSAHNGTINAASFPSSSLLVSVRMLDIPGGALQIMTQRPDLWQVKDRSIICIS